MAKGKEHTHHTTQITNIKSDGFFSSILKGVGGGVGCCVGIVIVVIIVIFLFLAMSS